MFSPLESARCCFCSLLPLFLTFYPFRVDFSTGDVLSRSTYIETFSISFYGTWGGETGSWGVGKDVPAPADQAPGPVELPTHPPALPCLGNEFLGPLEHLCGATVSMWVCSTLDKNTTPPPPVSQLSSSPTLKISCDTIVVGKCPFCSINTCARAWGSDGDKECSVSQPWCCVWPWAGVRPLLTNVESSEWLETTCKFHVQHFDK